MSHRLRKFQSLLASFSLDSYIHANDTNIRYLTGFPASESLLVSFPTKSIYLTDSRYTQEAKKALKSIAVEQYDHNIDKSLFDILAKNKVKNVGFDDRHWSLNRYQQMQKDAPRNIKFVCANDVVENMRTIKEKREVDQIRKCLDVNLAAYKYLKSVIVAGLTERDVLLRLENYVRARRAGFSFDPIIASGPHSAYPHAKVTDRKICGGQPVLVDMGIDINGYKSDLTRMFFLGRMPDLYKQIYAAVSQAQSLAIAKIRDGVKAADVDSTARNYLESLGLAKYFGHSLGHGVGLDIHEAPRISAQSGVVLKKGMVVTVEPGVYLPGKFGIRLEEMVLVTKSGCEVLSRLREC